MSDIKPWIGVDFDSTLRRPDGAPILPMIARVKSWIEEGFDVRIVTARMQFGGEDAAYHKRYIQMWCMMHIGKQLEVQWGKSKGMVEFWDDKAVRVEADTGKRLSPSRIEKGEHEGTTS